MSNFVNGFKIRHLYQHSPNLKLKPCNCKQIRGNDI